MHINENPHVCSETYEQYLERCQKAEVKPLPQVTWETVVRDGKFMKEWLD